MHSYIKQTYDNLDFYNLSKTDCLEILRELFSFFYNENIYKDSEMCLKQPFLSWVFDTEKYHSHYEWDIMLLKLYRKWLIEMKLYECDFDLETEQWKTFYRFLEKYLLPSVEFESTNSWKVEYDLEKICKDDYEKFIFHICENIIVPKEEEEYLLDYCLDRILYYANIKNTKIFFSNFSKILQGFIIEKKEFREDFIKLLNESKDKITITYKEYIDGKSYYLSYLQHLESKWKLELIWVQWINIIEWNIWFPCIEFRFKKIVWRFFDIYLESLEYNINNKIVYKNDEVFIGDYKISFHHNSKIKKIYLLLFDYFFENRVSFVSYEDMRKYYLEHSSRYAFKEEPKFLYSFFRRDIEKKNEQNEIYRDFLGLNYSWISCKYLSEETFS